MDVAIDTMGDIVDCTQATTAECKELVSFGQMLSAKFDKIACCDTLDAAKASLATVLTSCEPRTGTEPKCCETYGYGRKLMYLDPDKRFTILVLRWLPGAATRIHGHNAWGVVGVHSGDLTIRCYDLVDGTSSVKETMHVVGHAGDISAVGPAPEGIHAISNETDSEVYSVHIYGMDLSEEPEGINVYY